MDHKEEFNPIMRQNNNTVCVTVRHCHGNIVRDEAKLSYILIKVQG